MSPRNKAQDPDEFRWIVFRKTKVICFSLGEAVVKQKLQKGIRIRVKAFSRGSSHFDVTTAMGWSASLSPDDFTFVVAPNPVIESYPDPVPGILQSSRWDGSRWIIPSYFNGLPVLGNKTLKLSANETRKPVIRLSLNRGADKKLYYDVSSFALE